MSDDHNVLAEALRQRARSAAIAKALCQEPGFAGLVLLTTDEARQLAAIVEAAAEGIKGLRDCIEWVQQPENSAKGVSSDDLQAVLHDMLPAVEEPF